MVGNLTRRQMVGGVVGGGALATLPGRALAQRESAIYFRDILLVDGSGAAPRRADVAVLGDQIATIAPPGGTAPRNARLIEGEGRVLAPGFIDTHTHGDPLTQSYDGFLAMGVTTVLLGMDGSGPRLGDDLDLRPWLAAADRAPLQLNVATLASHGTVRRAAAISDSVRRPDDAALARLSARLDAELAAGAFGLSYGLEYVPGIYAEARELATLGQTVARHGGVVMSHMRSENDEDIEASIDELITSSNPARSHISHLKVVFGKGEARARALLDYIAAKRRAGIDLTADAYPYNAGYTGIALLFPEWALPPTDYAAVVASRRQALRDHLIARMTRRGGPDALLIGTEPYAGKTLAQAAAGAGMHYADFLIRIGPQGGSGAHFTMDEALQGVLVLDSDVAISTDGGPGMRHPRATGTYAKLIEHYVVDGKRLSIEQAVRKSAALPAQILRLPDRGVVRVGAKADLILFAPDQVKARSTYVDPFARAEGFDMVLVNGQLAFEGGDAVGRSGALLRSDSRT
ncbi:N-acyl-D-amino-acid deacylase family protein [Sphingomonas sp. AX6]|uniref:N-acyl-D-amino-acid deacylase family protein n=1 Tax=Sphingomonas sp. AX6 TaxID=2653171 RepID=UPI0012F0C52E|nr:amidohydrolase family protein [Sphingomonas sp. AX6]VXC78718.1 N-acyl-D-amino acid deacylase [Sphingomonas sp. AX6]